MVGWNRIHNETWHDTRSRIKTRVAIGFTSTPHQNMDCQPGRVARVVTWNPELNWHDNISLVPKRRQGRLLTLWDDKLQTFCKR